MSLRLFDTMSNDALEIVAASVQFQLPCGIAAESVHIELVNFTAAIRAELQHRGDDELLK